MKANLALLLAAKLLLLYGLYYSFRRTIVQRDTPHYVYVPPNSTKRIEIAKAQKDFFLRLCPLDGQFYKKIAHEGYTFRRGVSCAFFPLFPAVVAAVARVTGRIERTGIALNFLFSLCALLVISKIIEHTRGNRPLPKLFLMLAFPAAGAYSIFYTESLFLLLSSLCLYSCMKKRVVTAGLLGFLCAFTRAQGFLLTVPLTLETAKVFFCRERCRGRGMVYSRLFFALLPLFGFFVFAAYLAYNTGYLFAIFEVQGSWGRSAAGFLRLFSGGTRAASTDILAALFGIALIPYLFTELPFPLGVWGVSMALFPLLTGTFLSYLRFIGTSFPHFIAFSSRLEKRPVFWWAFVAFFIALQLLVNRELMAWRFVF